ncbi:Cystathionine beta-synthase [Phytophthora fragariae]|uniref:Cystathionine beta-synthase n=1 Tax=Phytophthora fragariae TaxID=53985 RepID=A0A6A3YHH2_9STRA|nr:Cystathionine beta-synthase [Phytophthora fragariae]KAE8940648.1 Cystathionine beta-synthase [Phytophthora fragariae]KAE9015160.1 Cystathionine beta-synthase [Phytophthora fragariae]KAE9114080.1 Cystathionine beta-synthase [Phytophthora fragariae]KAE9116015.1 Cystathionine beta-synthase [Phytophthora fragariae]
MAPPSGPQVSASAACASPETCFVQQPHVHRPRQTEPKILNSILDHVGNTPLVRLNTIARKADLECELLAKCEFFNAGGSVKDRIGKRMIEDAMASGRIKPGDTLIEPTSGNTGIGLALAAALYGFRIIITLPEKMSLEKVDVLKALGAEIIRTPTEAAWDSPESHIGVAKRLVKEIPNAHILDQYSNPSNPLAHYDGTAEEILEACDGHVDMVVMGAGTGGTLSGTARKIKEKCPSCIVVGADPIGSILAEPENLNDENRLQSYQVEGIGYDFIPQVLDRALVDRWIKTGDQESFLLARRLIREEGLLCGGSCGSAVAAALKAAKDLKAGQRCVVVLPDSTRNYMSKFLSDDWMYEHGYVTDMSKSALSSTWWAKKNVSELLLQAPVTITPDLTCKEAVDILKKEGFDNLPVVADDNSIVGVVSEGNLIAQLMPGRVRPTDAVERAMFKQFKQVSPQTSLYELSRIFDRDHFALVVTEQKRIRKGGEAETKSVIFGVVTRIDLLTYITRHNEQ